MDILKYGGDCQVVEPAELRERRVVTEFKRGLHSTSDVRNGALALPNRGS